MSSSSPSCTAALPLDLSDAACVAAMTDFGGLVHERPLGVVYARDVADVVAAVRLAAQRHLEVTPRGQGHSTRGQAQAAGGVVVDLSALAAVRVSDGRMIAQAGARWDAAFQVCLEHALTPAVMTDFLGLSVGGTLSVGGVGGQSFRHGFQTDQVEELTVVTGAGEVVVCSATRAPDLFTACRGGLGQCAIIVEARLRLLPAPSVARVCRVQYADLRTLLGDQARAALTGTSDYLLGSVRPDAHGRWSFGLELVEFVTADAPVDDRAWLEGLSFIPGTADVTSLPYEDYIRRLGPLEAELDAVRNQAARHPWMDLFLPDTDAGDVIAFALSHLSPKHFTDGHLMTYALPSGVRSTPLLPVPGRRLGFLFDVLPTVAADDDARLAVLTDACRRIWAYARARGARIYPIGFPVGTDLMDEPAWRRQFGDHHADFVAAKRKFDPGRRLTPGPGIRWPA